MTDMTAKKTIDVFIAMNEDGDYTASKDKDDALESLYDNYGYGYNLCRLVKIKVSMSPPVMSEGAGVLSIADGAGEEIKAEVEAEE